MKAFYDNFVNSKEGLLNNLALGCNKLIRERTQVW